MNPPENHLTPPNGWVPGYHSLRRIHRSRSSEVYLAVRSSSDIQSVVKVLLNPGTATGHIETLQRLSGVQGVVSLLDLGRTGSGQPFVVLPLYPQGSFGQVLGRSEQVSLAQAVAVGRSVGPALTSMHGHGLVHNAVAPENILSGSTSLLTGFGATTRIGSSGIKVRGRESFLHAPPEALHGDQLTPASDVYRLASTLWTLLTGRTPFSLEGGEPLTDQMYAERILDVSAPPVPRKDVSRVLSRVLTRAMAKDPEERYQSAVDLASALERARTGVRTGAQPSFAREQAGTHPSRPPEDTRVRPEPTGPQAPPVHAPAPPPHPAPHTPPSPVPHAPPAPAPYPMAEPEAWAPYPPPTAAPPKAPGNARSDQLWGPQPPSAPEVPPHRAQAPAPPAPQAPRGSGERPTVEAAPTPWNKLVGWSGDMDTSLPMSHAPAEGDPLDDRESWDQLDREPRWRRHLNIGVVTASIMVFTVATGVVSTMQPQSSPALAAAAEEEETEAEAVADEQPEPVAEPSPFPEVTPPSEVSVEDTLSAVTLTWSDHTGGTGSYFVLGGKQGHDPITLARTGPGAVTAQVPTEDTGAEYCFTVVAVDGGSAPADEVCTTRAADRAEAERLAEEEAAEEEEEEDEEDDEEDADPSPSPGASGIAPREDGPIVTGSRP